jgi:diaminopimelate decarboxylase
LTLDPDAVRALAAQHGTPLYVYDGAALRGRVGEFRAAFPRELELLYAVKANACPDVVALLSELTDGLDVASTGELALADEFLPPGKRLGVTGPAKPDPLVAYSGPDAVFMLESLEELAAIERLRPGRTRALVRVSPSARGAGFAVEMGGGRATPFGFDEEALDAVAPALRAAHDVGRIELLGVHVHAGSQTRSWRRVAEHFARTFAIAARLEALLGLRLPLVDLGGGLGARQTDADAPLALAPLGRALAEQLAAHTSAVGHAVTPILELGRALVGEAGTYVTRVVRVKASRGERVVVVDGGVHHLALASTWFGPRERPRPPIVALGGPPDAPHAPATITGVLCTPLDTLGVDVPLPPLAPGSLLAFRFVGAYALGLSPVDFLGHPRPAQVLVDPSTAR